MKTIPVVFAANDEYVPMFGTALHSLIAHTNQNCKYEVFLLTDYISADHQKLIHDMETGNVSVEFIDVSEHIRKYNIPTVNHLSKETTYRLLIPKLFSEYEKVVYLDSDILLCRDIAELFETDIEGCVLAAVRARLFRFSWKYITEELMIDPGDYFNAGILLINVPEFERNGIGEKGLKMLSEKKYNTQDQDVLNILCQSDECKGKIHFLDGRWNVEWEHLTDTDAELYLDKYRKASLEYIKDPFIIHYTTAEKPWNHPEYPLAYLFWKEAKNTPFFKELIQTGFDQRVDQERSCQGSLFDRFVFPWDKVNASSKMIIYGAGSIGRLFVKQMEVTGYAVVEAICDKRYRDINNYKYKVIGQQDLIEKYKGNLIVIAVEKKELATQIKDELIKLGIDEDRIIWSDYKRKE